MPVCSLWQRASSLPAQLSKRAAGFGYFNRKRHRLAWVIFMSFWSPHRFLAKQLLFVLTLTHHLIQQFSKCGTQSPGEPWPLQRSQGPHCLCEDAGVLLASAHVDICADGAETQVAELLGSGPRHGRGSPRCPLSRGASWPILMGYDNSRN